MSSTSTMETRVRDKRAAVPMLLESFPLPPSFIPPSPSLATASTSHFPRPPSPLLSPNKPPLSAPPSAPLPPVPGPSPITEHETLMFISAARSRRASKMSLASVSTYSHRDSIISVDDSSISSLSPSTSITPYDSSRSIRSFSSTSSLSVPLPRHAERSPVIQARIAEEDAADLTRMSLDEISMHSTLPEHLSDDEKVLDFGISLRRAHYDPRDSISSVDVNEIPLLHDDEMDAEAPLSNKVSTSIHEPRRSLSSSSSIQRIRYSKALPALPLAELPPLPVEAPPQPLSRSKSQPARQARRPSSPDIQEILATTPRPRRKSSHGSGLRSRSASRSTRDLKRRPSDCAHEARSAPTSRRTSAVSNSTSSRISVPPLPHTRVGSRPESSSELAYEQTAMVDEPAGHWDKNSFLSDYGVTVDETGTPFDILDGDEEARLDRELDGDGSDSDSSIDLHTPLPQLMVRDGLLSPSSKLVQSSRNTTPLPDNRPGSVFSVASSVGSAMTKNGLFKDERDTVKRRVRHRDGRLLKGGIGLTTGLGWSDSEDEDAPSPLIHQISSGSLKKRASSSSRSLNSLSRSFSDHVSDSRMEEFGMLPKVPRSSAPPTSWQRPRHGSGLDRRTSTSSSLSSGSSASTLSRTFSRTSVSSYRSAPASTSRRGVDSAPLSAQSLGHIRESDEMGFTTPSTSSSTASLVTPITPAESPAYGRASLGSRSSRKPLVVAVDRGVVSLNSPPKTPRTVAVPRPLRLPQTQGSLRTPSVDAISTRTPISPSSSTGPLSAPDLRRTPSQGLRPPQASARPPAIATSAPPHGGISFPLRTPTKPVAAMERSTSAGAAAHSSLKLKPRTGTGMVYRTTPNTPVTPTAPAPAIRPSMMRMPSSTSLRSAKGAGF